MLGLEIPDGTFDGYFPAIELPEPPDVRLALEFTHRPGDTVGKPNIEIAERLAEAHGITPLPVFASLSIVRALHHIKADITVQEIFQGPSAKGLHENTGTRGELFQSKRLMARYGLHRPELHSSGYNIGNIYYQATQLFEMQASVPVDSPRSFDWHSDQIWTKHQILWCALAYPRLRKLRKWDH